jgi:hypothetical protein
MIKLKIDTKDFTKTVNNVIQYSNGFIDETKASKNKIAEKMGKTSINAFYDYLDSLARMHPGMLHHVYEWGEVGNPVERLYELNLKMGNGTVAVNAEFLESISIPENGTEAFYNKAQVMEDGQAVVVNPKNADYLFFEVDGTEVFSKGPIRIANPGGAATRGSFLEAYNEFYKVYFSEVYLRSIKFYDHLSRPSAYEKNVKMGAKSYNPRKIGKGSALEWITNLPGDDLIES